MKHIFLFLWLTCCFTVLAQSGTETGTGVVTMESDNSVKVVGTKTFTSHVIPDGGNVANMLHVEAVSLLRESADLSGGIKCKINAQGGSVKLNVYAYNPNLPNKKGACLYAVTNTTSTPTTFSGTFGQVPSPIGSGTVSSGAIKTLLQVGNAWLIDKKGTESITTDLFTVSMAYINYQPKSELNTPLNNVLKGNNFNPKQPVIVEVIVTDANVMSKGLKYPGMVEDFDLYNYFNPGRILSVTIKVNGETKQTLPAGNTNPTPINLKLGDLVTYDVTYNGGNDQPVIEGMPGVWIARYAGDLMYYCTPSVTPGEFKPWIGYDSRVHNMQLRNKDGDPEFYPRVIDWSKRNNVFSWSWTAQREMDASKTKYTPEYTWIKYKTLKSGGIQRNNQREGLNVQFLNYWQEGENSDFREYKGTAQYMMGFDDDELFYLNSQYHDAKVHKPLPGGGIAKLDSIPSRGMPEGADQIYDKETGYPAQGFPLNMQISAYQKNREWVVNKNPNYTKKYNGYEIQDIGTNDENPDGKGLGNVKAPGTVYISAGGQVVTIKFNATAPLSIYRGFYGNIEGNRWPAYGEKDMSYTLTGLNGMTTEELDRFSMVYHGCDALGNVFMQIKELKSLTADQKKAIASSGRWTALFNNDYPTYSSITAYYQRSNNSEKVMIAGKELKPIFILCLGEKSFEGKGLGAKIWLNDFRENKTDEYSVQRRFGNRIVYTSPNTRTYTVPVNATTTFQTWDGDPHIFYDPGVEWFLSSRTLAKRLPDNYLDGTAAGAGGAFLNYYVDDVLQTSGRSGKDFTYKWTTPGTHTLKVVYRIQGVLTSYQHKINVIDYPNNEKGKITYRNITPTEAIWLNLTNPDMYKIFEVTDVYSQHQYKDGPRANNPDNRWAEHNDYAAQYTWNRTNPDFVPKFLSSYTHVDWFWKYWALHYSSNWRDKLPSGLPPYVPTNLVTRVITTELDTFATAIKSLFEGVTQAKWQYTVPLVSYTDFQGYRMRTNPSCLYDLSYMFNNQTGAFSTTPVLPSDPSKIQAPDITDEQKDKQEFYYALKSGRIIIVNILGAGRFDLKVSNTYGSQSIPIASLWYEGSSIVNKNESNNLNKDENIQPNPPFQNKIDSSNSKSIVKAIAYPNPVVRGGSFGIKIDPSSIVKQINVYNSIGNIIQSINGNTTSINTTGMSTGSYVLQIVYESNLIEHLNFIVY